MQVMLKADYICGFVDGEGSFHVAIYKDQAMKYGIKIIPEFHVSQRISSKNVLEELKSYFNCGYIKANHAGKITDQTMVYVVRNRQDLLTKIIPFFKSFPLQTEKGKSFIIFAKIVNMLANDKHANKSGIKQILKSAYSMNRNGRYRRKIIAL